MAVARLDHIFSAPDRSTGGLARKGWFVWEDGLVHICCGCSQWSGLKCDGEKEDE